MAGLVGYGAYLPYHRLRRDRIGAVLGGSAGRGMRAVAGYDEDATTLAVEAGRIALARLPSRLRPHDVMLATTSLPYLEKTNATAAHAALRLDRHGLALDLAGAVRSGVGALLAGLAAGEPTMVLAADVRTGLPGSTDERDGGDAAAAFVTGRTSLIAELLGHASVSEEMLERWRTPGARSSRVWEERFAQAPLQRGAQDSFAEALKRATLTPAGVDHLVVTGLHRRAAQAVAGDLGVRPGIAADDLSATVGNTGTAHAGLLLASVLDRAGAGEVVAVVVLADGATTLLLRTTAELVRRRSRRPVAEQLAAGDDGLEYPTFLAWRGMLDREPPRRPEPPPPYAPPAARRAAWKFGFVAARCTVCGTRVLPPGRACRSCHSIDAMEPYPMAEVPGQVATFTVDELAVTPSPPLLAAVVDFDGGGRLRCQVTDARSSDVAVGTRVEMTFRRMSTVDGVHNYFWKARPLRFTPLDAP